MDQQFADSGQDNGHLHQPGDELEIDFDLGGVGTDVHQDEHADDGHPDNQPFTEDFDFDLLDDDQVKQGEYPAPGISGENGAQGIEHGQQTLNQNSHGSPQHSPDPPAENTPSQRAESEIDYEGEGDGEVDGAESVSHHHHGALTRPARRGDTHGPGEEAEEDEITYEEEDVASGVLSEPAADDQFAPQNPTDQQVLGEEIDGIAFDFEDDENDSAANDQDTSGENSIAQGSLVAEEMAWGSTNEAHSNPHGDDVDDESDDSSEGNIPAFGDAGHREANSKGHTNHYGTSGHGGGDRPYVTIFYNGTEYDLFAEDEDADPNSYFLMDVAPLDYTLTQFLSCLRGVLSGEVKKNEKIFVRIDSLGLEFGETTSKGFLDQKTFRMILSVHERLQRNDGQARLEPLSAHLVTRTDCPERFDELVQGAHKGLGLSAFASSVDLSEDEDDSPTKPAGAFDTGLDASADDEFSEHYEGNASDSPDHEDDEAENEDDVDHSTGIASAAQEPNSEDADNFGSPFDEDGNHEDIGYDEGIVTEELVPGDTYGALGESLDHAGQETGIDGREDDASPHQGGSLDAEAGGYDGGGEEFVDYDDEDDEAPPADAGFQTNGNLPPFSTVTSPQPPRMENLPYDDLIDYSDDEDGSATPTPISEETRPRSSLSSPSRGLGLKWGQVGDGDLIDYSDDENEPDTKPTPMAIEESPIFHTVWPYRIEDDALVKSSEDMDSSAWGAKPTRPVKESRVLGSALRWEVEAAKHRLALNMSTDGASVHREQPEMPAAQNSDFRPEQPMSNLNDGVRGGTTGLRTHALQLVQVQLIKAAHAAKGSVDSSCSEMTVGSDFSIQLSYDGDANLPGHQEGNFGEQNTTEYDHEQYEEHINLDVNPDLHGQAAETEPSVMPSHEITQSTQGSAVQGNASNPTTATSTLNGDDAHLDTRDFAADISTTQDLNLSGSVANNEIDEIDWEEHGDDEGQFPGIDLTPSSTSGKRSRQDESGGVADGTEAKRRRT